MRGAGGGGAIDAGRVATGATGGALAEIVAAAGAGGATAAGGGTTGRTGGAETTGTTGLATGGAPIGRGGGATGAAATFAAGADTSVFAAGGATAGLGGTTTTDFSTCGGTPAGYAGAATVSFRCVMAFKTSPGREMCDRSILVLISSSPRAAREAALPAGDCPSDVRKWTRTFSASKSSSELECVFFSVTPTCVKASRMALLLTSSSRARSLIRTLLIRPFVSPCFS
jgi:hypothetical protein